MTSPEYSATRARLRSEFEAARLEDVDSEELVEMAREVVELALDHHAIDDARASLGDVESVLDPADPGSPMLLDYYRARIALAAEDGQSAVEAAERAVAVARDNEFDHDLPHMLDQLAKGHALVGQEDQALAAREEAAQAFEETEQPLQAALDWAWVAEHGPVEAARQRFERALELAARSGSPDFEVVLQFRRGAWHADRNEYLAARQALQRGLDLARELDDELGVAHCLEQLAWLETEAFNHHEAIRVAGLALDAALDDWQRARALDARANAQHRLHRHREARADLLRAAEAYVLAGDREWAKDARRRADGDRFLHLMHYLPSWMFRHKDMSTRESAFRKQPQPFYWWFVGIVFAWPLVGAGLTALLPRGGWRAGLALVALAPTLLLGVLLLVGVVVTKRNDRRDRTD